MSPAPDRDSKRTRKNEEKKEELPVPAEAPIQMGPTSSVKPPPGLFATADPEIRPKKLFADTAKDPSGEGNGGGKGGDKGQSKKDESKDDDSMSE
eukprot:2638065-Karenia_brevis.AAC.1